MHGLTGQGHRAEGYHGRVRVAMPKQSSRSEERKGANAHTISQGIVFFIVLLYVRFLFSFFFSFLLVYLSDD
jgi:hypothetical protein